MKKIYLFLVSVLFVGATCQLRAQSCGVSAIYGGGPYYKLASTTIPEIRASGFTTAVVWTIHIDTAGDLNFNAEFLICSGGQYVGTSVYPDFPANMALLKTQPTSVTRIEFGLSASGSTTFANIKTLIAAQGTGPTSILYRNFKALKDTIPVVDAINFDDETTYDVASSVQFSVMLADLGYKVTLCPYTDVTYWKGVISQTTSQRPGAIDAVYLQCYSGGAGNSPCSGWSLGPPIYPGLWDSNYTPSGVYTKMAAWKTQCAINGGFMWLYDDFHGTPKTAQYANAIDSAIGIGAPSQALNESPADSAINIGSNNDTLRWSSGACALSHDVYFGTTSSPPFIINQTDTNYAPGTLSPNTNYYWRIDEKNFFGTTTGAVWLFNSYPEGINLILPQNISISSYPNPFSDQTNVVVNVAEKSQITISVFNIFGEEVAAIANKQNGVGRNIFTWNGINSAGEKVSAGIYLMRVTVNGISGSTETSNIKVLYLN